MNILRRPSVYTFFISLFFVSLFFIGSAQNAQAGLFGFDSVRDAFDGGGPGASGNSASSGGTENNSGNSSSGYTGLRDMFDGGGPGASGNSASSEGRTSGGIGDFFKNIFSGRSGGGEWSISEFPGGDRDDFIGRSSAGGSVDLIPGKTNIVVSEATTVFSGQILVTDERGRSCTNNRQEYFEGASIESFTSDDDTQPYIPGATFVCYKGEWVNEEELPAPEEPIACTQEYMPVCGEYLQETCDVTKAIGGCDLPATKVQKTYSNSCEQKAAGATLLRQGTCEDVVINCDNPPVTMGPESLAWQTKCSDTDSDTTHELSARPQSGQAPLSVTFTSSHGDHGLSQPSFADGQDTLIDFDDDSARQWVQCAPEVTNSISNGLCMTPQQFSHTYQKDGTYTAKLVRAGGFCVAPGCPETVLASMIVTVGIPPNCPAYYPSCSTGQSVVSDGTNSNGCPIYTCVDITSNQNGAAVARASDSFGYRDEPRAIHGSNQPGTFGNSSREQAPGITNQLLIDYGCDTSVDQTKEFSTPYNTLRSGNNQIIPLSVRMETGNEGNHCFAFKVDTTNTVRETNENNNVTQWHNFSVVSSRGGVDPAPNCPIILPQECQENETLVSGSMLENGCRAAPQCIATASNTTAPISGDEIMFEVKAYTLSDTTASGVQTRITTQDWSTNTISLASDEQLAFRWDASGYRQCLVFLYPERYVFDSGITSVTGNTETLGIDLRTLTQEYKIQCSSGDITREKVITVTAP